MMDQWCNSAHTKVVKGNCAMKVLMMYLILIYGVSLNVPWYFLMGGDSYLKRSCRKSCLVNGRPRNERCASKVSSDILHLHDKCS